MKYYELAATPIPRSPCTAWGGRGKEVQKSGVKSKVETGKKARMGEGLRQFLVAANMVNVGAIFIFPTDNVQLSFRTCFFYIKMVTTPVGLYIQKVSFK